MSFLGMGPIEIVVILVIAFIFLGPERMVEAARMLGKLVAEARRMAADLPDIVMDEGDPNKPRPADGGSMLRRLLDDPPAAEATADNKTVSDQYPLPVEEPVAQAATTPDKPLTSADAADDEEEDGPVAFKSAVLDQPVTEDTEVKKESPPEERP